MELNVAVYMDTAEERVCLGTVVPEFAGGFAVEDGLTGILFALTVTLKMEAMSTAVEAMAPVKQSCLSLKNNLVAGEVGSVV